MAGKTTSRKPSTIPRYTIEKPKSGLPAVAKIVIPRVTWEALPATLEKLLEQAGASEPKFAKGTLTLY